MPWWMVDLQGTYLIDTVRITTLMNHCKFCLFDVFVDFILLQCLILFVLCLFVVDIVVVPVCLSVHMRLH